MSTKEIYLPSLKGIIGDWSYYTCLMTFKEIGERISFANEVYQSKKLNDLIQREVIPKRKNEIADYIQNQEQRFFNAMTVGVFGGEPKWFEFSVEDQRLAIPIEKQGVLGNLYLNGEELLFPIDGQHRLAGIKELITREKEDSELLKEEIPVIFVGHERSDEGFKRIRRLFTTLNRYAKPVSPKDAIALDEDDIAAICSRQLIESHHLFEDNRISLNMGSSISRYDKSSFTNINTLYRANSMAIQTYLNLYSPTKWRVFKRQRPPEENTQEIIKFIFSFWDYFISHFEGIKTYLERPSNQKDLAHDFRKNDEGDHILFRPVGLLTYLRAIFYWCKFEGDYKKAIYNLSKLPTDLTEFPWENVIFETGEKRMITREQNQKLALNLTLYLIGFDLSKRKINEKILKEELASILNKEIKDVKLPKTIANK